MLFLFSNTYVLRAYICIYVNLCMCCVLLFLFTQARVTLNAAMQIFLQLRPVDDAPRDVRRFRLHF